MTSRFTELSIDCHDPHALDYAVIGEREDLVEIGSWEPTVEAVRQQPNPATLVFAKVPEDKVVKNRVHLDVSPIDGTRDEEVERLIALGARRVDIGQGEQSWVVLADPDGNEFLRPAQPCAVAGRPATARRR